MQDVLPIEIRDDIESLPMHVHLPTNDVVTLTLGSAAR